VRLHNVDYVDTVHETYQGIDVSGCFSFRNFMVLFSRKS